MVGLQMLLLSFCGSLGGLPESVGALTGLHTLDLAECKRVRQLPEGLRLNLNPKP